MGGDDSTIILTDIKKALASTEEESSNKPACLLGVGGVLNGTIFDLTQKEITIGRQATNTITLEFQGISRNHFMLNIEPTGGYSIIDNGSRNGTYLNNRKLEDRIPLAKGDIIKLGNIALKYIPAGDPERNAYDKLNQEANTDGHTGCYNKSYFNAAIELEVKKCKATGTPLSLILFDLDKFKNLNDNFGHDAGDYVLKKVSDLVHSAGVRDRDIFARYGGEEFTILLPQTNLKHAFEVAERLRKLIESNDFVYDDQKLPVTVSMGVADYRQGVLTGTDLFKRADSAVYKAKDGGRNQVQFYKS